MKVPIQIYVSSASYIRAVWDGNPALTVTLHTSGYVPDRVAHIAVSDLSNELPTGGGYTAGGTVLTGAETRAYYADDWPIEWTAGGVYDPGNTVRPITPNGFVYRAANTGVASLYPPVWPTEVGTCITDGTVTWTCSGSYIGSLVADDLTPAWAGFTAGPYRHMVISSRTDPDPTKQALFGTYTYPNDQQGTGDDFTVVFDPSGVIVVSIP